MENYTTFNWKRAVTLLTALLATFGVSVVASAMETPDSVVLNQQGEYFGEVEFDHAMHEEVGACEACHHHATGGGTSDPGCVDCHADSPAAASVACSDCHLKAPFSAAALKLKAENTYQFHADTPGLKGALHRNCLGCHELEDGPVGCQDCHDKTDLGEDLYAGALGKK